MIETEVDNPNALWLSKRVEEIDDRVIPYLCKRARDGPIVNGPLNLSNPQFKLH